MRNVLLIALLVIAASTQAAQVLKYDKSVSPEKLAAEFGALGLVCTATSTSTVVNCDITTTSDGVVIVRIYDANDSGPRMEPAPVVAKEDVDVAVSEHIK